MRISNFALSAFSLGMTSPYALGYLNTNNRSAISVYAQKSTYCSRNVCFAVNVPASTASSGSGDIYFQITGPSSMSWISLGQGSSMRNSNIFFICSNAAGNNVTPSARTGTGDSQPSTLSSAALTLLSGSGISNGVMIANVKCSNCNSWTGGSMSLTSSSTSWIWAYKSGSAVNSDSETASLAQHAHNGHGSITLDLRNAAGGSSSNPFLGTTISSSISSSSTASASTSTSSDDESGGPKTSALEISGSSSSGSAYNYDIVRLLHAVLGCGAFVALFPIGALAIRILSFKNPLYFHAWWMVFAYVQCGE